MSVFYLYHSSDTEKKRYKTLANVTHTLTASIAWNVCVSGYFLGSECILSKFSFLLTVLI
jgi:hypothetical protein